MVCHGCDHAADVVVKKENEMNLIDKYIAEVGKHLPRKQRADIEAEIRSTLEDMLDEQSERKQAQGAVDDALVIELLKEYGTPRQVAESYTGPRYLIGPRIYPIFELVTKIVMACVFGALLLAFVISGAVTKSFAGTEFISFLAEFWSGLFGALISTFGSLVITFAIMERVMPAGKIEKEMEEDWNPADLAKEPDPDEVKMSESIATIIFTSAGLIIFNLYPNIIGFGFMSEGEWTFVPILSEAFFRYLPWINLLGVIQIVFSLYQLRQKVWTLFTRLCWIAIEIGSIALAVAMLTGPALIDLNPARFSGTPLAEAMPVLAKIMQYMPWMVLFIIIVVSTIEVAQMIYHLIKGKPASPYAAIK
jgi:hypothetical protein